MSQNYTFYNNLLQCVNKNADASVLLNFASSMKFATENDLYQVLELIHLSHEIQIQVKLFSILTVYLISNGTHRDIIIKFNPLYDKICVILTRGLPKKSNITLNFLTALLYTEDEDTSSRRRTLVFHAQNMIRISGCLMAMSNLFSNSMLHQDTWQALCRCLAESCFGLESNQNYCSHLIPFCVRRCRPGNDNIFQLVQSLLCNNDRNIKLFYECGGNSMFNREFLGNEQCLQLLNTVASMPVFKDKILNETDIIRDLQHLKQLYGPLSQVGQWVTIIMYTVNFNGQGINRIQNNKNSLCDKPLQFPIESVNSDEDNDTAELFKNVIKEFLHFQPSHSTFSKKSLQLSNPIKSNRIDKSMHKHIENIQDSKINNTVSKKFRSRNDTLPFSFLIRNDREKKSPTLNYLDDENFNDTNSIRNEINSIPEKSDTISRYVRHHFNNMDINVDKDIFDFKPTMVSTPKQNFTSKRNKTSISRINKKYNNMDKNNTIVSKVKLGLKKSNENVNHGTIGARIFNVINESCTTIMKSVRNVFRSKRTEDSLVKSSDNFQGAQKTQCSNSFTNYMRQRDALLNANTGFNSCCNELQYECNTCNDTVALKRKFSNDDFLKETVNKLKLGINLYGCNFKKISKTFWSDENYMTPSVLYNLYRKLIVK